MKFQHEIEFMRLAKEISNNSKDPSRKIGAIAVSNNDKRLILSTGWNGFPRGIIDKPDRLNHRETKYTYMVHAEKNCIYNACYNGISLHDSIMFVYGLPVCSVCALGIIQCGISSIVCQIEDECIHEPWLTHWLTSKKLFDEVGLSYTLWNQSFQTIDS